MPLTAQHKRALLTIARNTIETHVNEGRAPKINETDPALIETRGAFVTLHKEGALRGCIGTIIGQKPLYLTVRDMALAAATQDPRFTPVTVEELSEIDIEISVLTKPVVVKSTDEIILGTHGVIIEKGAWHSGVFLPQVALETGWSKDEFLAHLCAGKAGLPADAWKDPTTTIKIFSADVFSEKNIQ